MENNKINSLAEIIKSKQSMKPSKAPAYPWQDLALQIIKKLNIPNFKRGAVFKVCKEYSSKEIKLALNDTKELCTNGQQWKYFFKIITQRNKK